MESAGRCWLWNVIFAVWSHIITLYRSHKIFWKRLLSTFCLFFFHFLYMFSLILWTTDEINMKERQQACNSVCNKFQMVGVVICKTIWVCESVFILNIKGLNSETTWTGQLNFTTEMCVNEVWSHFAIHGVIFKYIYLWPFFNIRSKHAQSSFHSSSNEWPYLWTTEKSNTFNRQTTNILIFYWFRQFNR